MKLRSFFVSSVRAALVLSAITLLSTAAQADESALSRSIEAAQRTFFVDTGGQGIVSFNGATETAQFVRFVGRAPHLPGDEVMSEERVESVLARYGGLFGVTDSHAELELTDIRISWRGGARFDYQQTYQGVPVFAGLVRLHFNARGAITAMNGLFVPDIEVDVRPTIDRSDAEQIAVDAALLELNYTPDRAVFATAETELQVFRRGLLRGHPGGLTHLAYFVEVTNQAEVREFLHVDAHTGKVVHRFSGIHHGLRRVVYDGRMGGYNPNEPDFAVLRQEGDPPTGEVDVDEIYDVTGEIYNLFYRAFGYDSYDGQGHDMLNVAYLLDRNVQCPNASWNGTEASFCEDVWSDDVVAHEWAHAYTEYTHNLIYAWQPGALNEAYSDIFGHTVDLLNEGCELEDRSCPPMSHRTPGFCSAEGGSPPPIVRVFEPASISGDYRAAGAAFGPQIAELGTISGTVVAAEDGSGDTLDACQGLDNAEELDGNIALVNRGDCFFAEKTVAVQEAGAIAVIIVNLDADEIFTMGAVPGESSEIPAVMIGRSDGETIREALGDGVSATIQVSMGGVEETARWLIGSVETGVGVLRDMWNPTCFGHPGHVGDDNYYCGMEDGGGVHLNSGIPNHAYSLLVDGGAFNGYAIDGIGLTKAAHIYWISMSEYQTPATGFAHHADALEASCADLVDAGTDLPDLNSGEPTGQVMTAADCETLAHVISAIELREAPPCDFSPVLQPDAPRICVGGSVVPDFEDGFEDDPAGTWILTHQGEESEYRETDWEWVDELPADREGSAMFAQSSFEVGDCGDDDQSGVVNLTSPPIALPADQDLVYFVFDHYVATEPTFDGGNLAISVNGGDFQLIDADAFEFNPYNHALADEPDNTNPLEGQDAFTGVDQGTVNGTWGQSQIRLTDIASAGDEVQIRFRMGVDGCNGIDGWYVDGILVAHCGPCATDTDCEDYNDCTTDVCNPDSGECSNEPVELNTPCGDPADSDCTAPDTCDAEGVCRTNHMEVNTACGHPGDTECDNPDTCDGEGSCRVNHAPMGAPCGDSSDNSCDRPDICDAAGECNTNLAPERTPCGDRSDNDCTETDTCDAVGVCHPNDLADGLECSSGSACLLPGICAAGMCMDEQPIDCDDGDPCTTDECDAEEGCVNDPIEDCPPDDPIDDGPEIDFGFPEPEDEEPPITRVDTVQELPEIGCCGVASGRRPGGGVAIALVMLFGFAIALRRRRGP